MKLASPTTEPTAGEMAFMRVRVRCQQTQVRRWIRETFCPRRGCPGRMEKAKAYPAEPDIGLKAFAGGFVCTECGCEVED